MNLETAEELYDGRARICIAPEQGNYSDVFGEPEGYTNSEGEFVTPEQEREEIVDLINRDGLWCYFAQVKCECCGQWKTIESIGMVIGELDNAYREDFVAEIERNM